MDFRLLFYVVIAYRHEVPRIPWKVTLFGQDQIITVRVLALVGKSKALSTAVTSHHGAVWGRSARG